MVKKNKLLKSYFNKHSLSKAKIWILIKPMIFTWKKNTDEY